MNLLFSLAVIKFIQCDHGVLKSFAVKQSESSIHYKEMLIFSDINQSESSFNGHGIFNKFYVNQSKLSSTSHGFSTILLSFVDIKDFFTGSICGNSQSE